MRANPDVDTWLPGEGTEVVLPTRYVLPHGKREGVILNLAEYRLYYFPTPKAGEAAVVMTYPIRSDGLGNAVRENNGHFEGSRSRLVYTRIDSSGTCR